MKCMVKKMTNEELRIYVILRTDIEIPKGKAFAQVGHAVLGTAITVAHQNPKLLEEYMGHGDASVVDEGQAKIVLRGKEKDLHRAATELKELGIPYALIQDAGRTVFPEPTFTCIGIGPVRKSELPKFIQRLQLHE